MESCKVATMNEWGERRSKQTRWFDGSTSLRITAGGGGAAEVQVTVLLKGFVQSNRWQISKAFSVEYQFRRFIGCVQYTAVLCLHQDWTQDHGPSFWRCHSEPGPVCSILEPRHSSSHPKKEKQWRMSCTTKSNLQVKHIDKLQTNECAFTANMLLQVYKNLNKLCTRRQVSCSWHWNTCHGSHGPLPTALGAWSPERMWHVNVTAMMCSCKASALTFVHPSSMETLEGPPIPQQ